MSPTHWTFAREVARAPRHAAALALLLLVLTVVLVALASRQRLGYDSYWHVFIAGQDTWQARWQEIAGGGHPRLYFATLNGAMSVFGKAVVAYRSVSILAVAITAWLTAGLVWRATANLSLSLVAASSFGLSFATVAMAMEVRSYAMHAMLLAMSAVCGFDWVRAGTQAGSRRAATGYVVTLTAALLTDYSTVFFAGAAAITPIALLALDGALRRDLVERLVARRVEVMAMCGVPLVAATVMYVVHISRLDGFDHVGEFQFDPAREGALTFLGRNTVNLARLMLPAWSTQSVDPTLPALSGIPLAAARTVAAAIGVMVATGILALRRAGDRYLAAPVVLFVVMLSLNAIAGLAGVFPYGGRLRHEFYLMPFGIAGLFCLIEAARRQAPLRIRAPGPWFTAAAVGVLVSTASWASAYAILPGPLFQPHVDRFMTFAQSPQTVLVDQFNLINIFSSYHDWTWIAAPQQDGAPQVWTVERRDRMMTVCRDVNSWQIDLSMPGSYHAIRRCLDDTRSGRVAVFRPQNPGVARQWRLEDTARIVDSLAPDARLQRQALDVDGEHVYVVFVRRDP